MECDINGSEKLWENSLSTSNTIIQVAIVDLLAPRT